MDKAKPITPDSALPIPRQASSLQAYQWVLRFWIADFGFAGNKSFFEETEFSPAINSQFSIVNIQFSSVMAFTTSSVISKTSSSIFCLLALDLMVRTHC